jgi:hypothetical protein
MAETEVKNDPKAAKPEAKPSTDQPAPEPTPEQIEAAKATLAAKPKRQKTPIPEGFIAPVEFARKMDEHLGQPAGTTPPQVIYGFIKNSSQFPFEERGADDFPRFIVKLDDALKFVDDLQVKRVEKAQKKAAKDAALAAALHAQQAEAKPEQK